MIIDENSITEIVVYVRRQGKRKYEAYTIGEIEKKKINEITKKSLSEVRVKMKELTWGLHNGIQETSYGEEKEDGSRQFSYAKFKEGKLNNLIVEWDVKNSEGEVVEINPENISRLPYAVAEAMLRAYDEESLLGEKERNF